MKAIFAALALVCVGVTAADASTFQINATGFGNITGSFTADDAGGQLDPSTIANVNITAQLPAFASLSSFTFDEIINPTATWPVGYLWFGNSAYGAGSTHIFAFLTPQTGTSWTIGMGFNAHQSEISIFACGCGDNITGTITELPAAVPAPVAGVGLPGLMFAGVGLLAWWRKKRKA